MILPPLADLRAQLAAVINTSQHTGGGPPPGPSHPHGGYNDVHSHAHHQHQQSSSASPHDHNIDPAIGGAGGAGNMMNNSGGDSGGDDSLGDGRKGGKRELSQSKRAAQNRAAQVRGVSLFLGLIIPAYANMHDCDDIVWILRLAAHSLKCAGGPFCFVNSHVIKTFSHSMGTSLHNPSEHFVNVRRGISRNSRSK
jgi:hypothetical protein